LKFLRYPGGKSKLLYFLNQYLPSSGEIAGNYIEPFVGGGSVFLSVQPQSAILSDKNPELIELYKGIRNYPHKVWEIFKTFPEGKKAYYRIRDSEYKKNPLYFRAARTLYLNRTCFKGMWRHASNGKFNVGYGGEDRRWVITHQNIIELSKLLKKTKLNISDFELILDNVNDGDFIFLDPPYKPGEKELHESHYTISKFTFNDQIRLSKKIIEMCSRKNIRWIMTNSSHEDIINLYNNNRIVKIPRGTSDRIGVFTNESKEILILNY